jgi:class 3 adenylate cyclase
LTLALLAVGAYHSLASLGWIELMARRLAAILAAGVVGYSRSMMVDEARTHERPKALRQDFIELKIAEHHGRIAKLMGDGALVEFAHAWCARRLSTARAGPFLFRKGE